MVVRSARSHGLLDAVNTGGIRCRADKAYQGSVPAVRIPFRGRWNKLSAGKKGRQPRPPEDPRTRRTGHATLKSWRLLRKLRCGTNRITDLVKAVPTLEPTASI